MHRTCLQRRGHEGIQVAAEGDLNVRAEWRLNQIKRIPVHLTERELRTLELELFVVEKELSIAISNLSNNLVLLALPTKIFQVLVFLQNSHLTQINAWGRGHNHHTH